MVGCTARPLNGMPFTSHAEKAREGLSSLGEAVLLVVRRLSEMDRLAITHRLADDGIGICSNNATAEDSEEETTLVGQAMMLLFWLFVLSLAMYLIHVVRMERGRYQDRNAMEQGSFRQYLKYRFGYWYTWTPGSAGILLLLMSLKLLLFGGLLMRFLVRHQPLSESLWQAWLMIAAPDGGGSTAKPVGRAIGLVVSVGGMLVFALLLSVISTTFEEALNGLRRGVGPVIEGDHIVILGYLSPMLQIIAREICEAAESDGGTLIAILSPVPKPDLEEFLRVADGDMKTWMKNSTIVVRSGDASRAEDLAKVAVQGAKKVIIMSRTGVSREEADSYTVNVLLTLRNNHWPREGHCVVQSQLIRNEGLFKRLLTCKGQVLAANDFIGELMVQCSMQTGLIEVVRSVFSFEGDEFYIQHIAGTAGRTFMEVLFDLPGVIPVGVMSKDGTCELLPAMDRIIGEHDALCVLAEDDSTIPQHAVQLSKTLGFDVAQAAQTHRTVVHGDDKIVPKQTIIIIGWNDSIGAILGEIDKTVGSHSHVIMQCPEPIQYREEFIEAAQKRRKHIYQNFTKEHRQAPLGSRFRLEELPLEQASIILVLADESCRSAKDADSQTMAVVIQVQDILEGPHSSGKKFHGLIMPQLVDIETERTLKQSGVQDYVMSTRLAARIMAMLCQLPETSVLIDSLVKHKAVKFAITELSDYLGATTLNLKKGVSFNDVTYVAAQSNEVVLGWSEVGAGKAGPWEMNPKNRTKERKWPKEARLVVMRRTSRHADFFRKHKPLLSAYQWQCLGC